MCFELNAQLHKSCYITCRAVFWPCPNSCVLLLSSAPSYTVCGLKHWFIWCHSNESTRLRSTLGMSSHYLEEPILDWILLENYVRMVSLNQALLNVKETALETGYHTCPFNFNKYLLSIICVLIILQPLLHLKDRPFLCRNHKDQDVYFRGISWSHRLLYIIVDCWEWVKDFFPYFPYSGKNNFGDNKGVVEAHFTTEPGVVCF
jgi:hypothetical protein